jgi:hypothetical protein
MKQMRDKLGDISVGMGQNHKGKKIEKDEKKSEGKWLLIMVVSSIQVMVPRLNYTHKK